MQQEAVWEGVIQADSQWAYPREASFKKRLREVRTEYSRFKRGATKLKKHLVENFTEDIMYSGFISAMCSGDTVSLETQQAMQDWLSEIGELSES